MATFLSQKKIQSSNCKFKLLSFYLNILLLSWILPPKIIGFGLRLAKYPSLKPSGNLKRDEITRKFRYKEPLAEKGYQLTSLMWLNNTYYHEIYKARFFLEFFSISVQTEKKIVQFKVFSKLFL